MIFTVTLNPAIDRSVFVESINRKDVTRVQKTIRQAAGKGINVSKVLQVLGTKSTVCAVLAGENGQFINNDITNRNLETIFQYVDGNTRENIKVLSQQGENIELTIFIYY